MNDSSFSSVLFSQSDMKGLVCTAQEVRACQTVPKPLQQPVRSAELENWFVAESKKRLKEIPDSVQGKERQDLLEMPNRYPDGSMTPISLGELLQMKNLLGSAKDIVDRARQGAALLKANKNSAVLGTAARGIPGGGASSRAAKWTRLNPDVSARFGLSEDTPRPLFRAGTKTLMQHTLDFSQHIGRCVGRVLPNVVMTNSENVDLFLKVVREEWGNWRTAELENTVFFNQIVLPRIWVSDQTLITDKLYPAGHGDYPYLFAKYGLAKALDRVGIRYFVFSNADEWLWQADPVMISIAEQLFQKGHHMVIMATRNTNNQFGGGFVRKTNGTQSLVETPRLPWEIVKKGTAPVALNTTFYLMDVAYLAAHEQELLAVEKSLVVKEIPGRRPGGVEQIIGVDSWAGDVFAAVLNPAFIEWPRLNFLGIKDGGFVTGSQNEDALGGRTYLHYVNETVATYPMIMKRLIEGDAGVAEFLWKTGYGYLP